MGQLTISRHWPIGPEQSSSEVIWVKLDRRFFGFRSDLLLFLCYVTPVNSSFQANTDFDIF